MHKGPANPSVELSGILAVNIHEVLTRTTNKKTYVRLTLSDGGFLPIFQNNVTHLLRQLQMHSPQAPIPTDLPIKKLERTMRVAIKNNIPVVVQRSGLTLGGEDICWHYSLFPACRRKHP
jgi:hypothetical protein